jgi:hypothetical protein
MFVAAPGEEEMVQSRRNVFCDNSVALLCKKWKMQQSHRVFLQESTLSVSYLQWRIGEAPADASCFLKDASDIISLGCMRRDTAAMRRSALE